MSTNNYLKNIAVVGAGGNVGSHIVSALQQTGKHTITAITRTDSSSKLPAGITAKQVDYTKPETISEALRGQDALVITLSGRAFAAKVSAALVTAAAEANVQWILPNEWAPDTANDGLVKDLNFLFQPMVSTRNLIEQLGKSAYTAIVTGFWYEYTLEKTASWGFDFAKRKATFIDDGETPISTSTLPHVGRAVAAFLSLPIEVGDDGQACLEDYRNKVVYTNSFTVSQRDMLASACRVTGTKESDWEITKEDARERFALGQRQVMEGNMAGFGKVLYSRLFFPGDGDFEHSKGTINGMLGLPTEDLDEASKVAVESQLKGIKH